MAATTTMSEETKWVKCYCCGLIEECTLEYIDDVKERYQGRWICGLCGEAVKEETLREMNNNGEEALKRHMSFCEKFRSSSTSTSLNKHTHDLILAMKNLLVRSLDHSPNKDPFTCLPFGTMSSTTQQPEAHNHGS